MWIYTNKKEPDCLAVRFFDLFINSVAKSGAQQIQDQIIHIAAAQKGEKLRDLHNGDQQGDCEQSAPQFLQSGENERQEQTQRHEHDHIAQQFDQGSAHQIGPMVPEQPEEQTQTEDAPTEEEWTDLTGLETDE